MPLTEACTAEQVGEDLCELASARDKALLLGPCEEQLRAIRSFAQEGLNVIVEELECSICSQDVV